MFSLFMSGGGRVVRTNFAFPLFTQHVTSSFLQINRQCTKVLIAYNKYKHTKTFTWVFSVELRFSCSQIICSLNCIGSQKLTEQVGQLKRVILQK